MSSEPGDVSTPEPAKGGPVGQGDHVVQQGECIDSIANEQGFFWETLWNHPANKELRTVRSDPNALLPGDRVTVPELRRKSQSASTDARHRFRRRGIPARLKFQLLSPDGEPRAGLKYMLDIDGALHSGTTDGEGRLQVAIPPSAKVGKLMVFPAEGDEPEEYALALGELDPVSETSGVQARLNNLGIFCGEVDGVLGPRTRDALERFQRANGLAPTGEPDAATREKLRELHGS